MSAQHIRRAELKALLEQNRRLRELLRDWPAREIMMEYEKQWNEKREELLAETLPTDIAP